MAVVSEERRLRINPCNFEMLFNVWFKNEKDVNQSGICKLSENAHNSSTKLN